MADVHTLAAYRSDDRIVSAPIVAQALQALGGAAHRDAIVDLLMGLLHQPPDKPIVTREVDRVLRENAGERPLFARMFGPDSRRWMLECPIPAAPVPSAKRRVGPRNPSKPRLRLLQTGARAEPPYSTS
jgi:hypothetical protein